TKKISWYINMKLLELKEFTQSVVTPTVKPAKLFEFGFRFSNIDDAPPPPPSFSEDDLRNTQQEYYRKGFTDGSAEGQKQAQSEQADHQRQLMETMQQAMKYITPLLEDYRQTITQLQADMPRVA